MPEKRISICPGVDSKTVAGNFKTITMMASGTFFPTTVLYSQITVLVGLKAVAEATLVHFEGDIFDGLEFALDLLIVFRKIRESRKNTKCFFVSALQHKPGAGVSKRSP
jgi:hypothetical protein